MLKLLIAVEYMEKAFLVSERWLVAVLCVARQRSWTDPLLICQDGCFFQQGAGGLVVSGASWHGVGSPRKSVHIFKLGMCVYVSFPLVFRASIHARGEDRETNELL